MKRCSRLMQSVCRVVLVLALGSVFALDGCDPTIKATVLSGVEDAATGLATTFIQAFFQKLAEDDTGTATVTTTTMRWLPAPPGEETMLT